MSHNRGMKIPALAVGALLYAGSASAHVTVAPQQAPAGASQIYKVRVHNDAKTSTTSVMVEVPAGVTIDSVADVPNAQSDLTRTAGRVTAITWKIDVPVGKYVELPFTARNPDAAGQINWNVTERFKDGSTIEFSDKPDAKEKSSITKLLKNTPPAPSSAR